MCCVIGYTDGMVVVQDKLGRQDADVHIVRLAKHVLDVDKAGQEPLKVHV